MSIKSTLLLLSVLLCGIGPRLLGAGFPDSIARPIPAMPGLGSLAKSESRTLESA